MLHLACLFSGLLPGIVIGFALGAARSRRAASRHSRILDHDAPAPMRSAYRRIV